MFLRPHYRTVDGNRQAYWSLVESVRTERGLRQRVVAYLGSLDEAGRLGVQQAAKEKSNSHEQPSLFDDDSTQPRSADVDISKVRVENSREFGGPWLAWRLIRHLGLDEFLQKTIPRGDEEIRWGVMSLVRVLEELSQIRSIDVVLPTRDGIEIRKRCVTKPTDHQAILLQHLGLTLPSSIQQTKL